MSSALRKFKLLVPLLAAIASALTSGLCCLAPLLYLLFGISAAGLTGLSRLAWLQLPMISVSLLCIGFGFWRLYGSRRPLCVGVLSRRAIIALYWLTTPLVLILLFYPFVLPWFLEVFA